MKVEALAVLAIGAHPDDVELGCGGTIYKLSSSGHSVGIVDLTEGELGTRGSSAERCEEARNAARILQVSVRENLKIPDAHITLCDDHRKKVVEVIRKYRPRLVLAPYPDDRHPDHIHASNLITEACFYAGLKNLYPEMYSPHRPDQILYFMLNREFQPTFIVDISEQFSVKMAAVSAYGSQFYNPDYAGEQTYISCKGYQDALKARACYFGWKGGTTYGESFWVKDTLLVDDLFALFGKSGARSK